MENGKRVAKIVILAIVMLTITGITAVEAHTFSAENCPKKCPDSGLAFERYYGFTSQLQCRYIDDSEGRTKGYITLLSEHGSEEEAVTAFEGLCKCGRTRVRNSDDILNDSYIQFVYLWYSEDSEEFPDIEIYGYFLHIDKKIITEVSIKIGLVGYISDSDIAEAETRFQALAKCAHDMTGWKNVPVLSEPEEKYTLTLKHYRPYYKPEKKDDPRRAGDLVATLIDKETKEPVQYIKVVFYVEKDEEDKGEKLCKVTRKKILSDQYYEPGSFISIPNIEDMRNLLRFNKNKFLRLRSTDSKGEARTNYLHSLDSELFSEELKRGENGKITGTIKVVALTQEDSENKQESLEDQKWKIECEKSVDIELSSVAKIMELVYLKTGGKANVSVREVDSKTGTIVLVLPKQLPYELFYGDVILLDENDFIEVHWLTGTKMKMRPKTDFLEKNEFATVHIGGEDAGLRRAISQGITVPLQVTFSVCPMVIGIFSTPAGLVTAIPEAFAIGRSIGDYACEPLIIESYSTILIDLDETATVYTVEGTGRLHNKDNSTTNVTTGHKISVSPDGTFSQVSKFDRSELGDELSYLLDEIEGKPHTPTPVTPSVGMIHNIDSGEDFLRIQDAVDDSDTKSGDTITVDPGIYVESVLVYKELTIQSVDGMDSTTVHGNGTHAFNITTDRVKISGFSIGSGGRCGIRVADANDCIISDNTVSGSHQGIYMLNSNRNMISGNTVWFNDRCGIVLTKSSYNEIRNNNMNFNDVRGIGIWHGNENRITDNVMEENTKQGIYVYNSSKNKINDNTVFGCPNRTGIELSRSNDNEIRSNTVNANNHHGIGLWTSNENIIANNTVKDNRLNGIYVQESEHNVITYNDVSGSVFWHGIYIYLSDNNEIENNVVSSNNRDGVNFKDSDENTLADNAIKGNGGFGIYLNNASINNVFLNDVFDNTKGTADFINANTIWSSTSEIDYTYNGKSYTSKMGNHWIDYTGTDANGDGIGDVPYVIGGIDSDDYALMSSRENYFRGTVQPTPEPTIFDTGEGGYPSVAGTHKGKITPSSDITLNGVYAYPCEGTNGHIKSIQIYEKNRVILDESISKGKLQTRREQWWKFMDKRSDGLKAGVEYNYIIETSSYPQMIHTQVHNADGGSITCDEFVDVNGKVYNDWIPAFKLE